MRFVSAFIVGPAGMGKTHSESAAVVLCCDSVCAYIADDRLPLLPFDFFSMAEAPDNTPEAPDCFPTTRWSLCEAVRSKDPEQKRAILHQSIKTCWKPIHPFIRRYTKSVEEAENLTQAFLIAWLSKDIFSDADPQKGRFRSFSSRSPRNPFIPIQLQRHKDLQNAIAKKESAHMR